MIKDYYVKLCGKIYIGLTTIIFTPFMLNGLYIKEFLVTISVGFIITGVGYIMKRFV